MRIFLANWRASLTRERIWLIPVILCTLSAFLAPVGDISLLGGVTLGVVLFIGVCLGIALSRGQFAIASRPFSFCLPGYRESLAEVHFSASLLFSGSFVLIEIMRAHGQWSLLYPDYSWCFLICKTVSMILMGMMTFLVMEALRLALFRLPDIVSGFWSVVVFYIGLGVFRSVQVHRVAAVVGLVSVLVFFRLCLARMSWVKCAHRQLLAGTTGRRVRLEAKGSVLPHVERLFLAQMRTSGPLASARYFWCSLYRTLGPALLCWKWMLLGVVAFVLVCSYSGQEARGVTFIAIGVMAWFVPFPIRSNLLLPAGRRERYVEAVLIAVVISLAFVALTSAIMGLSLLAVALRPGSFPFSATDVRWSGVLLPCLVLPWSFVLQLQGCKWQVLLVIMIAGGYVLDVAYRLIGIGAWSAQAHMILFSTAFICGWALFLLSLRHVCLRGSLIASQVPSGA